MDAEKNQEVTPVDAATAREIEGFVRLVRRYGEAKKFVTLSYVAVRHGEQLLLMQGVCWISFVERPAAARPPLMTENLCAGVVTFAVEEGAIEAFIQAAVNGRVDTPHGQLSFLGGHPNGILANLTPYQVPSAEQLKRYSVLRLSGTAKSMFVRGQDLDWELRASERPFEGLAELLRFYQAGSIEPSHAFLDFVLPALVEVDQRSNIRGNAATLSLLVHENLDRTKVSLGYKIQKNEKLLQQARVASENLTWTQVGQIWRATVEIHVETGSIARVFGNYAGETQSGYWVGDRDTFPNPRRAVYTEADIDLQELKSLLSDLESAQWHGGEGFERGVARLLWLCGFSVLHTGKRANTDTADLFAFTNRHRIAVVECTTGALDNKGKLTKLITRHNQLKTKLTQSGHEYVETLPVMVAFLGRKELITDLERAKAAGVVVLTQEDIQSGLSRTLFVLEPDVLFDEARDSLRIGDEGPAATA